jgi:hypothetical protein
MIRVGLPEVTVSLVAGPRNQLYLQHLQPVTVTRDGLLVACSKRQDARQITAQFAAAPTSA